MNERRVLPIFRPTSGIAYDVLTNAIQVVLIAHEVFVIVALLPSAMKGGPFASWKGVGMSCCEASANDNVGAE
jgi:hypothetical protein